MLDCCMCRRMLMTQRSCVCNEIEACMPVSPTAAAHCLARLRTLCLHRLQWAPDQHTGSTSQRLSAAQLAPVPACFLCVGRSVQPGYHPLHQRIHRAAADECCLPFTQEDAARGWATGQGALSVLSEAGCLCVRHRTGALMQDIAARWDLGHAVYCAVLMLHQTAWRGLIDAVGIWCCAATHVVYHSLLC